MAGQLQASLTTRFPGLQVVGVSTPPFRDLTPAELAEVPSMPASLEESLGNLKKDHEFLLKGDVFTEDLIETWIEYKMANEVSAIRLRPHPHEFAMYFDA